MSSAPIRFSQVGRLAEPPVISDIMKVALEDPHLLSLAAGFTDTKGLPVKFIRDAAVSLATGGKLPEYLQYGTTHGRPKLRKMVARRLSRFDEFQSPSYHPDNVILSNGSQQALYLAVQVLCDPGDKVLVESPSYFVFLELLKGLGVQAIGMPVDAEDEIDLAALGRLLDAMEKEGAKDRIKAVYLESWFSNPSARCLSNEKKVELAKLFRSKGLVVPVLEDGAYFELYFEEKHPSTTIFALREFDDFPRIFFGTFTKPFATGLKLGYMLCDHPELLARMAYVKGHQDFGSSNYTQALMELVVEEGAYDEQLEKIRTSYLEKMRALHSVLLQEKLPEWGFHWQEPLGGMFIWMKGPAELDFSRSGPFFENAVKEGVLYVPGDLCFAPGGPKNYMRLSFGVLSPDDLVEAGKRLARILRKDTQPTN